LVPKVNADQRDEQPDQGSQIFEQNGEYGRVLAVAQGLQSKLSSPWVLQVVKAQATPSDTMANANAVVQGRIGDGPVADTGGLYRATSAPTAKMSTATITVKYISLLYEEDDADRRAGRWCIP
jgi:hypothetical protein